MLDDLLRVGEAAGCVEQSQAAANQLKKRMEAAQRQAISLGPAKLHKVSTHTFHFLPSPSSAGQ